MIQFLRGNKSQLEASQTIFGDGQPIFEKDTGQLKVGNGIDVFSSLPYVGASSSGGSTWTSGQNGSNSWSYKDLDTGKRVMYGTYKFTSNVISTYSYSPSDYLTFGYAPGDSTNVLWNNSDATSMSNIEYALASVQIDPGQSFIDVWVAQLVLGTGTVSLELSFGMAYLSHILDEVKSAKLTVFYFCLLS